MRENTLWGIPVVESDSVPPAPGIVFGVYVDLAFDRKIAEVIAAVLTINLLYGDDAAEIVGIKNGAVRIVLNVHKEQRDDAIKELRKVGAVSGAVL